MQFVLDETLELIASAFIHSLTFMKPTFNLANNQCIIIKKYINNNPN